MLGTIQDCKFNRNFGDIYSVLTFVSIIQFQHEHRAGCSIPDVFVLLPVQLEIGLGQSWVNPPWSIQRKRTCIHSEFETRVLQGTEWLPQTASQLNVNVRHTY